MELKNMHQEIAKPLQCGNLQLHFQKLNKALWVNLKKCYNNLKDTKEKQSEPSKSFSKYQSKTGR